MAAVPDPEGILTGEWNQPSNGYDASDPNTWENAFNDWSWLRNPNDVAGETNQQIDFIYLLVIIGRIKQEMSKKEYKNLLIDAFDKLDLNQNGTIEISELLYNHSHGSNIEYGEMKQIFDTIDTDHDGHITKQEYLAFLDQDF